MQKVKKEYLLSILKAGDLILTKSPDWVSRFVRWVTSSEQSHIAIYLGNGLLIESQNGYGVRVLNINEYLDDDKIEIFIARPKLMPQRIYEVLDFSKQFIGRRYDLFGLMGILVKYMIDKMKLTKWITFFGYNKVADPQKFWCSEFVAFCFHKIAFDFVKHDASYITPNEIYESGAVEKIYY
jgi:hypothetical protein